MKKLITLLSFLLTLLISTTAQSKSLSFDGVNDFVAVPSIATNLNTFTIELWIKPQSIPATGNMAILSTNSWDNLDGSSVHFQFENGQLVLSISGISTPWPACTQKIQINTWQHVAVTYDVPNSTICFYVNGVLASTINRTLVSAKFTDAELGAYNASRYYNGCMSDLRIWNTARTASEIATNMNSGISLPQSEAALIAYYLFNDGIANGSNLLSTTLNDLSASKINGTLNNFALTGRNSNWVSGVRTEPSQFYVNGAQATDMDGLSWSSAAKDLTRILDNSISGDVIWVAQGTYYPTTTTDRTISFNISDVSVFGGFRGNETSLSDRNIELYPTILSGNIGDVSVSTDNSYHVVMLVGIKAALISGFTISDGDGTSSQSSSGMLISYNSNIEHCNIINNKNATFGGGVLINSTAITTMTDCTFSNNSGLFGGGVCNFGTCTITTCNFTENLSTGGGAAFNTENGSSVILSSVFSKNISSNGSTYGSGGAIQIQGGSCLISNSLIINNAALGTGDDGGGAIMIYSGTLNVQNSTIAQNQSATKGGAVHAFNSDSYVTIENSILWDNTATIDGTQEIAITSGTVLVNYSIVKGATVYAGTGNLNTNPQFKSSNNIAGSDNIMLTSDDGFALLANSPAINACNAVSNGYTTDITGTLRSSISDMGAYEYVVPTSVKPIKANNQLSIYPNPVAEGFSIEAGNEPTLLTITNLGGSVVLTQQVTGNTYINISHLAQGSYILSVNGKQGKLLKK